MLCCWSIQCSEEKWFRLRNDSYSWGRLGVGGVRVNSDLGILNFFFLPPTVFFSFFFLFHVCWLFLFIIFLTGSFLMVVLWIAGILRLVTAEALLVTLNKEWETRCCVVSLSGEKHRVDKVWTEWSNVPSDCAVVNKLSAVVSLCDHTAVNKPFPF